MPSAELRLFVSSTFQDLHEEREHLVKKIFPEIRALCRERGITFTEVDLRWGLTHEEGTYGRIIRTCLEEIDRCRPYFIGVLGSRYGYVPEYVEVHKDPDLLRQHPWVEQAVLDELSITEMEMRYGVLNDPGAATGARFYLRRERASLDGGGGGVESACLDALRTRIRASGVPVQEFRDPVSLGELVYDDLIELIKRDFADSKPLTPLEQERARHSAFSTSRRHAYIPNRRYLQRIDQWFVSDEPPMVLYAESGSGKSSLVAFWCEQVRRRQPETVVVEHYIGIGAGDTDHLGLIRHVMQEVKDRFGRTEDVPQKPADLERGLGQWLGYAVHELRKRGERMVLVLDGLNQLSGASLNLRWIPDEILPEIRLIVTTTVEETLVKLRGRGWRELGMQPLDEAEREAVVVRFLSEYHKTLPPELVHRLALDAKCAHPLFLRTLLEELRVFGHHEQIEDEVQRLLDCTGTEDLFQRVLERIEEDYHLRAVRDVMSLIWCTRGGLAEEELAELTGLSRLKLSTLLLGLDYHLVRHEGLVTFFHDYLRRAVEKRYLPEESSRHPLHRKIFDYFARADISLRSTFEMLHAAKRAGDRDGVQRVISDIERFELLWIADRFEVMAGWAQQDLAAVTESYRRGILDWEARRSPETRQRAQVLIHVAHLFESIGNWSPAEPLLREHLTLVRELGDPGAESSALTFLSVLAQRRGGVEEAEEAVRAAESIALQAGDRHGCAEALVQRGRLYCERGEYAQALACLVTAESMMQELGSRRGAAMVLGDRAVVHRFLGQYAEAIECYRQLEAIAREIGNRSNVAGAIGGRGLIHNAVGEYSEALDCFTEMESIGREIGRRETIACGMANRGLVHRGRGEFREALDCYRDAETIWQGVGDIKGLSVVVGSRGNIHTALGEYDRALECYRQEEAIARTLCDRKDAAIAVGNSGEANLGLGKHAEALRCFHAAEAEHRAIGFLFGLTYWLGGAARAFMTIVEECAEMPGFLSEFVEGVQPSDWRGATLSCARARADECLAISRQLTKPDTTFDASLTLARIDAAEGRSESALQRLRELLTGARDDGERADCRYWLWKIDGDPEARTEALRLYRSLLEVSPRHAFRTRIEEMSVGIEEDARSAAE